MNVNCEMKKMKFWSYCLALYRSTVVQETSWQQCNVAVVCTILSTQAVTSTVCRASVCLGSELCSSLPFISRLAENISCC